VCVCVCVLGGVCVCVCEGERERERDLLSWPDLRFSHDLRVHYYVVRALTY